MNLKGSGDSCWAFSITGAVEGQYMKNFKSLWSFSEQQLIDCSIWFGLVEDVYTYLKQSGLERESDYPYTGEASEVNFLVYACMYLKK